MLMEESDDGERCDYLHKYDRFKYEVQKAEERESHEQLLTWRGNAAARASVGERWRVLRDALLLPVPGTYLRPHAWRRY